MENDSHGGNGSTENYFLRLWATQLNQPDVGPFDNFFELGGSSMQVIEMLMEASTHFGGEIDFGAFLRDPCVRTLCVLVNK